MLLDFSKGLVVLYLVVRFLRIGRRMPYSGDDMMNLYYSWTRPLGRLVAATFGLGLPVGRPFGSLVYRVVFAAAGFSAHALHWVVWVALIFNLWLAWRLAQRIGCDKAASWLAVLVLATHPALIGLSFNAGTLYDTFCFTFYVSALLVYLKARESGSFGLRALALIAILLVLALSSKEMAITLPVILLLWELLRGAGVSALIKNRGFLLVGTITALFVAAYVYSVLGSQGELGGMSAYTPVLSWARWWETTNQYLAFAFGRTRPFQNLESVLVYGGLIGLALILRSRLLVFYALWFPISLLSISFVPPRASGYVLYLPLFGWCCYLGTVLVKAWDYVRKTLGVKQEWLWQAALFVVAAVALYRIDKVYRTEPPSLQWSPVEKTFNQFARILPNFKGPSAMLFIRDPYGRDDLGLMYTLRLMYRDTSIEVHRLSGTDDQHPPLNQLPTYDHIFTYHNDRYLELDHSNIEQALRPGRLTWEQLDEKLTLSGDYTDEAYVVKDVLEGDGGWRWTGAEPEFRFRLVQTKNRSVVVSFNVVKETLSQTGPQRIVFLVNGRELTRKVYDQAGEQELIYPVPEGWLDVKGPTRVGMRIENPFISGADNARLGVLIHEVGFR